MEGFVESLLEFVIFSGLFYQLISLGSNLCIHLWAVISYICLLYLCCSPLLINLSLKVPATIFAHGNSGSQLDACDFIPLLWDSRAYLRAKRIHTTLPFAHFLNHCTQTYLLVVVASACSFSLSSHGAKNPTSASTFSVEPPSHSISKTFLCRFCGKKRSLSWLFVENDKYLSSGGRHNFRFRCWGINSTL